MNKRGLDQLLTTVILIGMVVILAVIMFFFSQDFFEKNIQRVEQTKTKFDIALETSFDIKFVEFNVGAGEMLIGVENTGRTVIQGFIARSYGSDNITVNDVALTVDLLNKKNIIVVPIPSVGIFEKIEVIPKVFINNELTPLSESKRVYTFTKGLDVNICFDGQTRNCPLQQGVCAGSFETCTNQNWPSCTALNYGANYQVGTEASCSDVLDNDCDGLIDYSDPDCAQQLDHYLNFFQIRFKYDDPQPPEPVFEDSTLATFTWGFPYERLDNYAYVTLIDDTADEIAINNDLYDYRYFKNFVIYLDDSEVAALFNSYGFGNNNKNTIYKSILRREDMQKYYKQVNSGNALKYGVQFNLDGSPKLSNGKVVQDATLQEYVNGQTMFWPILYPGSKRLYWNLANAEVRVYIAAYIKKTGEVWKTNKISLDNAHFPLEHFTTLGCGLIGGNLPYLSGIDNQQKIITYSQYVDDILLKAKNNGYELILNTIQDKNACNQILQDYLMLQSNNYEGMLAENRFNGCASGVDPLSGLCILRDIEGQYTDYLNWIDTLKQKNKTMLFSTNDIAMIVEKNPNPYRIWLWYHLVAQDNTYFYMNDVSTASMIHYSFYDDPLGQPIDTKPIKNIDGTWKREYEKGTIVFDPINNIIELK